MPGFGGILSIARSGLSTSQTAVQIASHNIANANTEGYSRQREVLSARSPETTPQGVFGTGVMLASVQRQRDGMLDQEFRDSTSQAGAYRTRSELLQRIEHVFGEPSDTGLASTMDKFYSSWSELASDPSNASARTAVQQNGAALARTLNSMASQVSALSAETTVKAQASVTDINRIAKQVADLNGQIVSMESGGATAGDLRDQRDLLLDDLSSMASTRVIEGLNGSVQVLLGTVSLVDGTAAKQIQLTNAGSVLGYKIAGSPDSIRSIGGTLGALQDVHNTDIGNVTTALDTLAAGLVKDTNDLHRTGWSPTAGLAGNWPPAAGPYGSQVDFFDATAGNATAARIKLSATVSANAGSIAAGTAFGEPGDNSLALSIAGLRDTAPSAIDTNFGSDYRTLVGSVAGQLSQANNSTTVYGTLTDQANQRRTAVFGVSVDEELIQIMRQQQAYAAASKIIKTVDEMMQTLLSLKQ